MKKTSMVLAALAVLAMACSLLTVPSLKLTSAGVAPAASGSLVGADGSLAALYNKVNPGVVTVIAYGSGTGNDALGSGFVYDTQGDILTNMHVIASGVQIEVDFPSGLMVEAKVAAKDPNSDIAVLKVDVPAADLVPLPLGDSSLVRVGDPVVAIGNPFALYNTMTRGIVSAKGRTDESLQSASDSGFYLIGDMIQTDAALNPGNSGGPLLNMAGEVIGINRSIVSGGTSQASATSSGLGFAISSNLIKRILPDLLATGTYDYPYMGLSALGEIHLVAQQELGLPYTHGVYVMSVAAGSPADKAGLRAGTESIPNASDIKKGGDLILSADGQAVNTFSDLITYITMNKKPGDTVTLAVYRDGGTVELPLTLGSRSS